MSQAGTWLCCLRCWLRVGANRFRPMWRGTVADCITLHQMTYMGGSLRSISSSVSSRNRMRAETETKSNAQLNPHTYGRWDNWWRHVGVINQSIFCEVEILRKETLPWKLDIAYRYIRLIGWKAEIDQLVRVKLNIDCLKICLAHRMKNVRCRRTFTETRRPQFVARHRSYGQVDL